MQDKNIEYKNIPDPSDADKFVDDLHDFVRESFHETMTVAINSTIKTVKAGIQSSIDSMKNEFESITNSVSGAFTNILTKIQEWFNSIGSQITNAFTSLGNSMTTFFNSIGSQITNAFTSLGNSMTTFFNSIGTQITSSFTSLGNSMTTFFSTLGSQITSSFTSLGTTMNNFFTNLGSQITTSFTSIGTTMTGFFNTLGSQMTSSFNSIGTSLKTFFDDMGKKVVGGFNIVGTSMTTFFTTLGKQVTDGFNSTITSAGNWFNELGKSLMDGFNIVGKWFASFAQRFIQMGKGLDGIFHGLFVTETKGLGEGLGKGFDNISQLMLWTGEFLFSHIMCGVHYIQNLQRCFFFYIVDMLGQILYLPMRVTLWFMKDYLKRDLYDLADTIWNYIYMVDGFCYQNMGFHFAHYPKQIRDSCYNCRRLKVLALQRKANQVDYDFTTGMRKRLEAGINEMNQGAADFRAAFQ